MEQSAFEAIMIGVNVFVFIIALTAGILLMGNVINMVNYANENAIVGMNGSLAETVGVVNERVYTGEDLLTYYRKYMSEEYEDENGEILNKSNYVYFVKLSNTGTEQTLKSYIEKENVTNYINEKFTLSYKGNIDTKEVYVFNLKEE